MLHELQRRIQNQEAPLGVIGLGYVGLPVACKFAAAGFNVTGVEVKAERVAAINIGQSPIEGQEPGLAELLARAVAAGRLRATTDYHALSNVDIVLICVETPVDDTHTPRYQALRAALRSLGTVLKRGALVIIESTIAPGTMQGVVLPILEEVSGMKANVDFFLGHCPERVMPGRLLSNLTHMSRVVGGMTPQTAETMVMLYRHVVQAELTPVDCVTAEVVKTAENAYRDVQIAFANELALVCEAVGADVWTVRELVNKVPYRHVHMPGAGVGGHCLPKDPWLLAYGAGERIPLRLIPAARAVNDYMPLHMADLVRDALSEAGVDIQGARVAVLGYAYLENSDDTRNSPSEILVQRLQEMGAEVIIHDPYVAGYQGSLEEHVRGCDAAVLMVAHDEYRAIDPAALKEWLARPVLVDGRHVYDQEQAIGLGFTYRGVGIGKERAGQGEVK